MEKIITKINDTVNKYNMLNLGDTVVVGVSGGADSMLLLTYLLNRKSDLSLNIIVANVEHGIRGDESVNDSNFVKSFCEKNNVEFHCLAINAVEEAQQNGLGVEEYSRNRRYDFFKSFNADKIATAHNLSDNVETVLFRLSRGTSIKGCCGIPAVRGNIIRPLIDCTSDEIRAYCNENSIDFVVDSTNSDITYSRNFVRNKIVPEFKNINPSFENVLNRFIESVKDDENVLDDLANQCFDECFKKNALDIDKLKKYPKGTIKRCIVKYVSLFDIALDDYHLGEAYSLLSKPSRCQIKKNYFLISDKKRIRMAIFEESVNFDTVFVNKKVISRQEFLNKCELLTKEFDFYCDYDKIVGRITIRGRDEGDTICLAGRNCTKSLKKLYNELKIPVEIRDDIPVVADESGLIGVCGYCCDERVKIDNTTVNVLLLKVQTED